MQVTQCLILTIRQQATQHLISILHKLEKPSNYEMYHSEMASTLSKSTSATASAKASDNQKKKPAETESLLIKLWTSITLSQKNSQFKNHSPLRTIADSKNLRLYIDLNLQIATQASW